MVECCASRSFNNLDRFAISIFVADSGKVWTVNRVHISEVFENSMFCVLLSFLMTSVLFSWWTFGMRKHFARVLNLLLKVDQILLEMEISIDLKRHKKAILFFAVFVKSFTIVSIYATYAVGVYSDIYKVHLLLLIAMFLCVEMAIFAIYHYTFWIWALQIRYEKVNLYLKENFLKSANDNVKKGNEKLCRSALVHDKLVDVSEGINRCYGVPVAF